MEKIVKDIFVAVYTSEGIWYDDGCFCLLCPICLECEQLKRVWYLMSVIIY